MGFCRQIKRLIRTISLTGVKLDTIGTKIDVLREAIYAEADAINSRLDEQLLLIKQLLPKPGSMSLLILREVNTMAAREFVCALALPVLPSPDTVSRKLVLQKLGEPDADGNPTNDGDPITFDIVEPELSSLRSPEFQFPNKQKFTATLTSKDARGNENPPHTQEFVVMDTIAPPADGDMGVLVLREIEVPNPTPVFAQAQKKSHFGPSSSSSKS